LTFKRSLIRCVRTMAESRRQRIQPPREWGCAPVQAQQRRRPQPAAELTDREGGRPQRGIRPGVCGMPIDRGRMEWSCHSWTPSICSGVGRDLHGSSHLAERSTAVSRAPARRERRRGARMGTQNGAQPAAHPGNLGSDCGVGMAHQRGGGGRGERDGGRACNRGRPTGWDEWGKGVECDQGRIRGWRCIPIQRLEGRLGSQIRGGPPWLAGGGRRAGDDDDDGDGGLVGPCAARGRRMTSRGGSQRRASAVR